MKFFDSETGDKLVLFVGASLIVLSLLALAVFLSLSVVSVATRSVPHFWSLCFFLCAISLAGWMLLYTGLLRLGGGVTYGRNNILLLYSLIVAVLSSTILSFSGHKKYFAILVLGLALAAFNIAVPGILGPRVFRLLKNGRVRDAGAKS